MATGLLFTSSSFLVGTTMSASASTFASANDIMGGTSSYDKRIYGISATSTDTTARDMTIWLSNGSVGYQVGKIAIALSSGNTNAIAQVDIFGDSKFAPTFQKEADANGRPYLNLPSGWSIKAGISTTTTAGTFITTIVQGENY